ncbi:MAG: hypothetical protein V4675_10420 [Verrucomicrobiota bacterium]
MTDAEILSHFRREFGSVRRPEKFTCEDGDPECMDHGALLHSRTPETLRLSDVDNICYHPWIECLVQGKAYFLPAVARLALGQPLRGDEWYAVWLACSLGQDSNLFNFCSPGQRGVILEFLNHLLTTRKDIAEDECWLNDMTEARDGWQRAMVSSKFSD